VKLIFSGALLECAQPVSKRPVLKFKKLNLASANKPENKTASFKNSLGLIYIAAPEGGYLQYVTRDTIYSPN
jgi:hypothetical protein